MVRHPAKQPKLPTQLVVDVGDVAEGVGDVAEAAARPLSQSLRPHVHLR